ncbi:hypothetical protein RF683_09445 [Flavobacterium sp. 20NA77.7]|uniref:Uncharacterized protein n=1 Tax=Flavobacterium nakdongensis TaxID=3073563 RepID=A0ABY9RA81_9FLAO|nr:hypothetical protein [Flavobacterium sp. 20NA77.7]WMW77704.1 hypothetical protein RF683_09445 [Flavobacterium sp. 20NA77.7]
MKKKIEGELISIAHRLLKLNNYKETAQLQDEVKKLYEQLTVLRFYEENFELVTNEIPDTVFEEKLEKTVVGVIEVDEDEVDEVEFAAPAHIQEMEEEFFSNEVIQEAPVQSLPLEEKLEIEEEPIENEVEREEVPLIEEIVHEAKEVPKKDTSIIGTTVSKQISLDDILVHDYKETEFVKKDDNSVAASPVKQEIVEPSVANEIEMESPALSFEEEKTEETTKEEVVHGKAIVLALNDRIAFEKNLFAGNTDDLNRVLSQLNTFTNLEEARSFVLDFVKPDYNNWAGKEEFETRFLEIVEQKFN